MNTRTPLAAAALLLMASSVMAQPYAVPNGGNFPNGNSMGNVSLTEMNGPGGDFAPMQFMGTSPDVQWADPKCNFIPCNTVDSAKSGKAQAALEKRIADQKRLTPDDTIVDMGNGKDFGIISTDAKGNKMISIDNGSSCGLAQPMSEDEVKKFAPQIAKDEARKADKAQMDTSINGDKNGMKINADNTQKGAATPPTPAGAPSDTPSSGYQDGASVVRGLGGNSSGGDSSGGDSSGGDTAGGDSSGGGGMAGADAGGTSGGASGSIGEGGTSGKSGGEGGGKKAIAYSGVKAKQEADAKPGYEFLGVRAAAEGSVGIGAGVKAAFNEGANAARPNVDDTYGDGKDVGKTQALANGGKVAP